MSRVYFFVFFLCLFSTILKAQDDFYATRAYTVMNGLPQSQVLSLLEDNNGYLWMGTHGGGLARFDGREFKVYTTRNGLLANSILGLHSDRHNNLWILHSRGVTKYNGKEFKTFQDPNATNAKSQAMWRMFDLNDTLFVLSGRDGITKIYKDSLYYTDKTLPYEIKRMHVGPNGEACFYLKDETFLIRLKDQDIRIGADSTIQGFANFFNYQDEIFLRSRHGTYKLDLASKKLLKMPWQIDRYVLYYDKKDDVFWTANPAGLFKGRLKNNVLESDTIVKGIETEQILRDAEGNTWIATNGYGLYKYYVQDFKRRGPGTFGGVMTLAKDREGDIWLGTMSRGLWKISGQSLQSYVDPKEPYRNMISIVRSSPKGEIWVGTGAGLGRYNKSTDDFKWYLPTDGISGAAVRAIEFDDKGMWVSTNNGLDFFDGVSFRKFSAADSLDGNRIQVLHYSKPTKTLFLGTSSALYALKDERLTSISVPELANTPILSVQTYKESMLVLGTGGGGVVILDPATNRRRLITTNDGLASDFIYFAAVDEKSYLWIGTEKGINKVLLNERLDVIENLHLNDDNGLAGVETNQNAFYFTPNEKLFGVVDGLYTFNHAVDDNTMSFDLHLTDVQILYGEYSPREYSDSTYGFFKIPYNPQLPPDKNHLTFHFNRVDKQHSKSVKYKYLLENFDAKWSQPSSVNSVTYSNLPPGDYVLKVMVTDNKGSWAAASLDYAFTILAPFYKTTAFIAGAIFLLAVLITLVFYIRVKQRIGRAVVMERIRQREQELVRKEIARDFHDEMGNQLTRIINYISLLKLNGNGHANGNGNGKSSGELYTKVEDSAKYLYSGTRDFIWSIDPVNDELSKLFLYVRDFGEKLFEEKDISFRAYNDVKEAVKLPYGFCRQANLIFKEVMTNAFKYSKAQNVSLSLKRDDNDSFEMSFEDDGIGFYTGDIQKMNGLQNIRERADRINAVLRIRSEKNIGTKIFLNFKITKTLNYGVAFQKTGYDRGG
jgi:ligand-binding sensor domain-containing protein/signal transduction histidine kinase